MGGVTLCIHIYMCVRAPRAKYRGKSPWTQEVPEDRPFFGIEEGMCSIVYGEVCGALWVCGFSV